MNITGWSLEQIDAAPAVTLDWLIAIDDTAARVRKEKAQQ